jgi:hypothetical protein
MKKFSWIFTGVVGLVGFAAPCVAQTTPSSPPAVSRATDNAVQQASFFQRPWQPRLCPPSCAPADPSNPNLPPPPTSTTPPDDQLPTEGRYKSSFGMGTAVSAGFGIGASVASAAAGLPVPQNNARTATITSTSTPLIMPGLLTAATTQTVFPVDRVFFDYGYFSRFAVTSPNGAVPGFNLNQFNVGVEKTFFNGMASLYVSVPFLSATQNVSGQDLNGLGDVSAGLKLLVYQNRDTGTAFSTGFTVAAPTAHSTTVTTTSSLVLTFTGLNGQSVPGLPVGTILPSGQPLQGPTVTTTVNPTYLQPWVGGLFVRDRFFMHEYFGVLIPTDSRVATIINNNLTFGYEVYRDPSRVISSITPTFGVQMLLPVNHVSNTAGSTQTQTPVNINCLITTFPTSQLPVNQSFGFPDQVFLTAGAQLGLGERCMFSAGVVLPVVGPRGYTIGGTFGLTFLY